MYRLGVAELNGELGLSRHPKDGVQWLKRSAEHATAEFPHALHELALLHERGIDNVLFVDYEYSAELLAQAAELGYAPSAHRLGECYEYGKMGCPQDPALSIHYYNIAAQQNHRDACFALTAWYLVGSPGVLPQSDTEAYLWARKAAEAGLAKAMYALGYFLEVGIGAAVDTRESMQWYKRAADLGDRRAMQRLKGGAAPTASGAVTRDGSITTGTDGASLGKGGKDKDKDCVIM
jgi:TPR repeat protein